MQNDNHDNIYDTKRFESASADHEGERREQESEEYQAQQRTETRNSRELRRGKKRRKKRHKKNYLLRIILIICVCVALYFILHIDYFTIDGIAVVGNQAISDEEVLKRSELSVGDNIFDAHPWLTERKIKRNLYIEEADVKRKLPNHIEITVKERSGKAQIKMDDQFVIIDHSGLVLEVADQEQKATLLEGITVKSAELNDDIIVGETNRYNKAMNLVKLAEEGDLYFKRIAFSKSQVNAYIYDDLVCTGR